MMKFQMSNGCTYVINCKTYFEGIRKIARCNDSFVQDIVWIDDEDPFGFDEAMKDLGA